MASLCFPWHGFAFSLRSHSLTHTLSLQADTLAARCLETNTYTLSQAHKHARRGATLISCLALLSGERHSWGDQGILWTTGHTNKQYSSFLSSLMNTFPTFHRQTPLPETAYLNQISPARSSPHLIFPYPFHLIHLIIFLIDRLYLSVSNIT